MKLLRSGLTAGVLVAALSAATPAGATVRSGNLLVNGDAQAGVGATDSTTVAPVPVPGWTTTPNLTEHLYQSSGSFPGPDASAAIGGGSQFFAGGPSRTGDNTTERAAQDVDLSAAAPEIDAGGVTATLAAALGGYEDQDDAAAVAATFLDAAGAQLGRVAIGPVTAPDRGSQTKLLARQATAAVPPGTRTARVVLTATKTEGDYNDGYADNVALTLTAAAPPPHEHPLPLPAAHGCIAHRRLTIRLPQARIVAARAWVNGHRRASIHGRRIRRLTVRHLPRGRFVLRVEARDDQGKRMAGRKVYRGCAR